MDLLQQLIEETIPIYTWKRPNPATGKEDCRLVRIHKDGKRAIMRAKLEEVVARYKERPEEEKEEAIGPQSKHEL